MNEFIDKLISELSQGDKMKEALEKFVYKYKEQSEVLDVSILYMWYT